MLRVTSAAVRATLLGVFIVMAGANAQAQDIPTIRFGRQSAAEDNLWLMMAKPDLAPNYGKAYKVEWSQFRASDVAFKAFEAGQVDLFSTNANSAVTAATNGIDLKIIASLSRESANGAHTYWLGKVDGGPNSIKDLKGKTIGILSYRTGVELWARQALKTAGLNPDTDVQWAVVPFSAAADAVRSGRVAVAAAVEAFAQPALAKGDLKVVFTSKTGVPFDEELIVVNAKPSFLKQHPAAVKAFLSDLAGVTKYLAEHQTEGRQALLDAKLVVMPPEIFMKVKPYVTDMKLRPNIDNLKKQQDVLLSAGFIDKKIDLTPIVDTSYLPQ
ncbi:ABC transporter substrate-binding protein [Pseudolabrys taiwanensis]|nr:ABC transporter substrate-binding protein [Pseudolabrys taiwanensis]